MNGHVMGKKMIALAVFSVLAMGCDASIEAIDMPGAGCTDSTFQVGLDVSCIPYTGSEYGYIGTLMPESWEIDTMYHVGDWTGGMVYNSVCSEVILDHYGAPAGYAWFGFVTESTVPCRGTGWAGDGR